MLVTHARELRRLRDGVEARGVPRDCEGAVREVLGLARARELHVEVVWEGRVRGEEGGDGRAPERVGGGGSKEASEGRVDAPDVEGHAHDPVDGEVEVDDGGWVDERCINA